MTTVYQYHPYNNSKKTLILSRSEPMENKVNARMRHPTKCRTCVRKRHSWESLTTAARSLQTQGMVNIQTLTPTHLACLLLELTASAVLDLPVLKLNELVDWELLLLFFKLFGRYKSPSQSLLLLVEMETILPCLWDADIIIYKINYAHHIKLAV